MSRYQSLCLSPACRQLSYSWQTQSDTVAPPLPYLPETPQYKPARTPSFHEPPEHSMHAFTSRLVRINRSSYFQSTACHRPSAKRRQRTSAPPIRTAVSERVLVTDVPEDSRRIVVSEFNVEGTSAAFPLSGRTSVRGLYTYVCPLLPSVGDSTPVRRKSVWRGKGGYQWFYDSKQRDTRTQEQRHTLVTGRHSRPKPGAAC